MVKQLYPNKIKFKKKIAKSWTCKDKVEKDKDLNKVNVSKETSKREEATIWTVKFKTHW